MTNDNVNSFGPGICPLEKVICVVVDECHRAVGRSDVVATIEKLKQERCKFRVLGLSATPGSKREAVQVISSAATTITWSCMSLCLSLCLQTTCVYRYMCQQDEDPACLHAAKHTCISEPFPSAQAPVHFRQPRFPPYCKACLCSPKQSVMWPFLCAGGAAKPDDICYRIPRGGGR